MAAAVMTEFQALRWLLDEWLPPEAPAELRAYFWDRVMALAPPPAIEPQQWAAVNDAGRVIGGMHPRAKLSDADIDLIHALRAAGMSCAAIAAKFDGAVTVSKSMVWYICRDLRRAQTVMGHKRVSTRYMPTIAHPDEFEVVHMNR